MREQEVRELYEAYLQVHQPQEVVEEVEELDENVQDAVKGALEKGANFMKTNPVGKVVSKIVAPAGKGRGTPTATSGGYRPEEVETDLFDTILEHLVSEGFADTNEAALVIMANMSEEWRQSIVEGGTGAFVPSRVDDFNNRRDMLKNRYGQDVSPRIPGPSGGGQGGTTPTAGVLKLARGTSSPKRGVESKNNA
jgi:hypothetical protein